MDHGMNSQGRETADQIRKEIHSGIVGQEEVIDELILCLFCGGHSLLIGVPGLAKTLLVSTIAKTLSLEFSRIQFTPDLMPSDMTGTEVMEEDKEIQGYPLNIKSSAVRIVPVDEMFAK